MRKNIKDYADALSVEEIERIVSKYFGATPIGIRAIKINEDNNKPSKVEIKFDKPYRYLKATKREGLGTKAYDNLKEKLKEFGYKIEEPKKELDTIILSIRGGELGSAAEIKNSIEAYKNQKLELENKLKKYELKIEEVADKIAKNKELYKTLENSEDVQNFKNESSEVGYSGKKLAMLKEEHDRIEKKLKNYEHQIEKLENESEKPGANVEEIENQIAEYTKTHDYYLKQWYAYKKQIDKYSKMSNSDLSKKYGNKNSDVVKYKKLRQQIREDLDYLNKLKGIKFGLSPKIETLQKEIESLTNDLGRGEEARKNFVLHPTEEEMKKYFIEKDPEKWKEIAESETAPLYNKKGREELFGKNKKELEGKYWLNQGFDKTNQYIKGLTEKYQKADEDIKSILGDSKVKVMHIKKRVKDSAFKPGFKAMMTPKIKNYIKSDELNLDYDFENYIKSCVKQLGNYDTGVSSDSLNVRRVNKAKENGAKYKLNVVGIYENPMYPADENERIVIAYDALENQVIVMNYDEFTTKSPKEWGMGYEGSLTSRSGIEERNIAAKEKFEEISKMAFGKNRDELRQKAENLPDFIDNLWMDADEYLNSSNYVNKKNKILELKDKLKSEENEKKRQDIVATIDGLKREIYNAKKNIISQYYPELVYELDLDRDMLEQVDPQIQYWKTQKREMNNRIAREELDKNRVKSEKDKYLLHNIEEDLDMRVVNPEDKNSIPKLELFIINPYEYDRKFVNSKSNFEKTSEQEQSVREAYLKEIRELCHQLGINYSTVLSDLVSRISNTGHDTSNKAILGTKTTKGKTYEYGALYEELDSLRKKAETGKTILKLNTVKGEPIYLQKEEARANMRKGESFGSEFQTIPQDAPKEDIEFGFKYSDGKITRFRPLTEEAKNMTAKEFESYMKTQNATYAMEIGSGKAIGGTAMSPYKYVRVDNSNEISDSKKRAIDSLIARVKTLKDDYYTVTSAGVNIRSFYKDENGRIYIVGDGKDGKLYIGWGYDLDHGICDGGMFLDEDATYTDALEVLKEKYGDMYFLKDDKEIKKTWKEYKK